ncbi:MAG: NAD(+)/NADH kinase [Deltaproteobacteria bacterium]|nr:NAD(+)/NADH kinase [Deltaproteobacteria bacterium]
MSYLRSLALAVKNDPPSLALAERMESWLAGRGVHAFHLGDAGSPQADLALSVGGDGSMISVARKLAGSHLPLAGVNTGRVGFLPELTAANWQENLTLAMTHGWKTETRLALHLTVRRGGRKIFSSPAANDVVIARGGLARLTAFELGVDRSAPLYLRADGLVVSTPTGSTAYSSSSGGPLLHPSLNAYSITAICPFQARFPPLVLRGGSRLRVKLRESGAETYATVDGQEFTLLREGDLLTLRGLPRAILLAVFGGADYFTRVHAAGFMADSPGRRH